MGKLFSLGLIVVTLPVTVSAHALHVALYVAERLEQIKDKNR